MASEKDCRDQLNLVLSFFSRVEIKLTAVLAVDIALLGSLGAHTAIYEFTHLIQRTAPLATLLLLTASFWCLYKGSFPDTHGGHSSLIFFKDIAARNEHLFIEEYLKQSEDARIKDILAQTWRNAEILNGKFKNLRFAYLYMACLSSRGLSASRPYISRWSSDMSDFSQSLVTDIKATVETSWNERQGQVVPRSDSITLGNDRVVMDVTILYADLADSTELAIRNQEIASELFKAYLKGVSNIIRRAGGHVRSFDGDRVMGVFFEGGKNTNAARCGLHINWLFNNVITPRFASFYSLDRIGVPLSQTVGIDTGKVHACRAGVRNDNDLIWVGRAPNVAAKLSAVRDVRYTTLISADVYAVILDESKFSPTTRENMWTSANWEAGAQYGVPVVYGSNWWWEPY